MHLEPFKELIKQYSGLIFESIAEKSLTAGLQRRIAETSSDSTSTYYAKLRDDGRELHELVCLLTNNETYFYREPAQLHMLVDRLIPRALLGKQDAAPVRILSAGCSTGEEPYSIAIALREKYGERAMRMFQIEGGDIDKGALEKARAGCYTESSFRSLDPELRERYFERHGKWAWNLKADLRRQVSFHHLNLMDRRHHDALQDYDVIFFRNVSIYFDMPTRRRIQEHLAALLNGDGCLIVGAAETLANDLGILNLVKEGDMFYFSKQFVAPARQRFEKPLHLIKEKAAADWMLAAHVFNLPDAPQACASPLLETPSCHSQPEPLRAAASIEAALQMTREKRYDDALAVIVRLLEPHPDASDALLLKAHIMLHRKEYALAEETAQRVLKTEAWSIDAFMVLALAAKRRNRSADAVNWLKQAVYACNQCWQAHYYLAELYRACDELEKARRSYRVVLQLLSGPYAPRDGLSIIPLDLPPAEVRLLCEYQIANLDRDRSSWKR